MNIQIINSESSKECNVRIGLSGEFDALGCKEIRADLEEFISDYFGQCIELDLGGVTFIDSSGVGAIVFLYKRMLGNNGSLKLVEVNGQPQELLSLLRVDQAIDVKLSANVIEV